MQFYFYKYTMEKSKNHSNTNKWSWISSANDIFSSLENRELEDWLSKNQIVTPLVWEANKRNGVTLQKISEEIEKERFWYSNKEEKIIQIHTKSVPRNMKKSWWLSENLPDDETKRYIFSHENAHHIVFYMADHQDKFPYFGRLYNILKTIREQNDGVGLSQMWNMDIYNSPTRKTAHDEDFVELLNRYCINPNNFKAYLDFLSNTDSRTLTNKGLFKLEPESAKWIFKAVSESVATFLKENNIINKIKK